MVEDIPTTIRVRRRGADEVHDPVCSAGRIISHGVFWTRFFNNVGADEGRRSFDMTGAGNYAEA